jgi:hypothetical protein
MLGRTLIVVEWVLVVVFVLALIVLALDLPAAWNAPACSIHPGSNCYPWSPGWAAEFGWHYANQRSYLISGIFGLVVVIATLAAAFWLRPGRRIIIFAGAIVLLHAGKYLLPHVL